MADASLGAALQVLFGQLTSPRVINFFTGPKLNKSLLEELKATLISVNGVIDDAEEKQITKKAVKGWLDELKDAVYKAEDLLDEIAYNALRSDSESGSRRRRYMGKLRDYLSSHNPSKESINDQLVKILRRFKYLVAEKDLLGLMVGNIGEKPSSHQLSTTCFFDESGIYGRDNDKKAVMELLLDDANGKDGLGVIPIVGMAGVGKTALAQLVYNDSHVAKSFSVKAWVCVSEKFDVSRVIKDILKELGSGSCDTTENQLYLEVKKKLAEKKYLLVLDDVWNVKYGDWDVLCTLLKKSGACGSKIIVTTRIESMASVMCTVSTHYLQELSENDCWRLFAKYAFDDGNSGGDPGFEVIGREIVKKCNGLPLAAKAVGGVLHSERDIGKWKKILKSDIWDLPDGNILPALRLSYQYLPSHLKRCFAYCAIFPKDYEIKKDELVLLWMAEGLLVQANENKSLEEVGDEYFNELVSRSFFQRLSGYQSCYVMNNLINDLAKLASGDFCLRVEGKFSFKITNRTRYLSYARTEHSDSEKVDGINEAQHLRTFLLVEGSCINDEVMHNLLLTLSSVRVLSLYQYPNLVELPESVAKMKHLRYLNLSRTSIQKLPDFVCTFYNLQTLILFQCNDLVELPIHIGWLINLYHLDIRGTKLQQMPPQMSQLKNLRTLTNFIIGGRNGSTIRELGQLRHLRGKLCISNLQNVGHAQECCVANLKAKEDLMELELIWNGDSDNLSCEGILEQLQPNTNMKSLSIVGYGGATFPNWVGCSYFSNIVSMQLSGWKHCSCLPPVGQLVSLKDLSFVDFGRVQSVDEKFYGSCMDTKKPFGSLKILKFERMPQWYEWVSYVDQGKGRAFPLLQELYIKDCPNLIKALPDDLPSLKLLEIEGCPKLEVSHSLPRSLSILSMKLKDESREVLLVKLFSGLYRLLVDKFHSLDSLMETMEQMGVQSTTFLEIEVRNCDSFKCFPPKLFSNLKTLRITRCPNLEFLFLPEATHKDFMSLSTLEIRECSNLSFPERGLPTLNLTKLLLLGCSKIESFPGMTLLPSTLTSLKIFDFQDLRFLDFEGLQCLTSLRELEICNCNNLQSIPKDGLPFSLTSLSISLCPSLEQRCQQETGEDWHRISHIRHIKIGIHRIK